MLDLGKRRVLGTEPKPVRSYNGRYYWACPHYYIDIDADADNPRMVMIGRGDQNCNLKYYYFDTFTWLMTDDEGMKCGRFFQSTETHRAIFRCNERGEIDTFTWPSMGGMNGNFSMVRSSANL